MSARGVLLEPRQCPKGDEVLHAAVTEAFHVGGHYLESARLWTDLARAGFEEAKSALKAAIAFYSAGDDESGDEWLALARAAGVAPDEVAYLQAQRAWRAGDLAGARAGFARAEELAPRGSGQATNALGALLWRLGLAAEAVRCFEAALARDPRDGLAATNLGRIALEEGREEEAARRLARAASLAPHRSEPFVLHSRLLRRRGDLEGAREALVKARLRRGSWTGQAPPAPPAPVVPQGTVRVRARVETERLEITARFEVASGQVLPFRRLGLNAGYAEVAVSGSPAPSVTSVPSDRSDEGERLAGRREDPPSEGWEGGAIEKEDPWDRERGWDLPRHLRILGIPDHAWQETGESRTLEIHARGLPTPPFVHLEEEWFELGGESGWLPLPMPPAPWNWEVGLDLPSGFDAFLSTRDPSSTGIGLVALREPERVDREIEGEPGRLDVYGTVGTSCLERAADVARSALSPWNRFLGPPDGPCPPVLVLNRPGSTFCYARPGFVRLASGILSRPGQTALVHHEVGHRWWGAGARFAPGSAWLAEALAEFSLHLAEDEDLVPGYRRATLSALQALGEDVLPSASLASLARDAGREAAFVLRAKGGFLVSMLREVIGASTLCLTLQAVLRYGRHREIDLYSLFALASWFHGATLDWFVNQWVHAAGAMTLSVEDIQIRQIRRARREEGEAWRTTFRAICRGVATPGAPVELRLSCEGEREQRVRVSLETSHADVSVTSTSRPVALTIDPDSRWYATIRDKTTRIES